MKGFHTRKSPNFTFALLLRRLPEGTVTTGVLIVGNQQEKEDRIGKRWPFPE
jgi:hypothetical protein